MKILNFGSMNYDYVYSVKNIVRPGETISSLEREVFLGGKGFNQSVAMARAGINVFHAGLVGIDGQNFLTYCKKNNIDITHVKKMKGVTGHAIIQLDSNAENSIILHGGANQKITREYVDEVLEEFKKGDILVLQNEINELKYIVDRANEKKMRIVLNPSPFDEKITDIDLEKIEFLIFNETEGEQLTRDKNPESMVNKMIHMYPNSKMILTLGSEGVIYRDKNSEYKVKSYCVEPVDTTAAGDTFTGYFIAGIAQGIMIEEVLKLCVKAAAITVSRKGASPSIPTIKEVHEW